MTSDLIQEHSELIKLIQENFLLERNKVDIIQLLTYLLTLYFLNYAELPRKNFIPNPGRNQTVYSALGE